MADRQAYYITTAISYPNDAPHIGHAYEAVATDALARFRRLQGKDVFFLTGTDEHGIKMLQTARKQGITASELADRNTPKFREMVEVLNCSNDDFISTREERHTRSTQELWRRMQAAGDIYLDKYAGWYSVRDEAYYDESELSEGKDGAKLSPQGTPVEWVEEESYFFRLSAFGDRLLEYYEANPDFIGPETRANEVKSFVRGGLKDLSVSRTTFDWGVPVPGDPKHVMYVWVDALTNYITGVGFPDEDSESFKKYWPADVHIIGKDIIRFHAVYWPAFLMSAGVAPPRKVFGHGFLYNRGEKMSKSVGNVVDPISLAGAYGVDPIRYFLLREVPFGQDGNYSHEGIVQRINADLANDLGNLAQRSLSMIAKNCGGAVPEPGALTDADKTILAAADGLLPRVEAEIDAFFAGEMPPPAKWLERLPKTRAVFEEAMRLYPPAPSINRAAIADDKYESQEIKAGVTVLIMPWTLHRHRALWENPDAFMPSRFWPENRDKIDRYQYLPFGAGPRICIGMGFALQEAVIALAVLLHRFRFDCTADCNPWPVQKLTTQPDGGLPMTVTRR